VVLSVVVICVGTAIAGIGEVNVTAIGLIFMFLAEFMEAIRLVMTQVLCFYCLVYIQYNSLQKKLKKANALVSALRILDKNSTMLYVFDPQYLLQNLKFGIVEGQYYLAPAGAICLLSVAMLMEVPKMVSTKKYMLMWEHPFLFLGAASLGLCMWGLRCQAIL
jgi:hypothetical protein